MVLHCSLIIYYSTTLAKLIKTVHRASGVCNDIFASHHEKARCDRYVIFESKLERHIKQIICKITAKASQSAQTFNKVNMLVLSKNYSEYDTNL